MGQTRLAFVRAPPAPPTGSATGTAAGSRSCFWPLLLVGRRPCWRWLAGSASWLRCSGFVGARLAWSVIAAPLGRYEIQFGHSAQLQWADKSQSIDLFVLRAAQSQVGRQAPRFGGRQCNQLEQARPIWRRPSRASPRLALPGVALLGGQGGRPVLGFSGPVIAGGQTGRS